MIGKESRTCKSPHLSALYLPSELNASTQKKKHESHPESSWAAPQVHNSSGTVRCAAATLSRRVRRRCPPVTRATAAHPMLHTVPRAPIALPGLTPPQSLPSRAQLVDCSPPTPPQRGWKSHQLGERWSSRQGSMDELCSTTPSYRSLLPWRRWTGQACCVRTYRRARRWSKALKGKRAPDENPTTGEDEAVMLIVG